MKEETTQPSPEHPRGGETFEVYNFMLLDGLFVHERRCGRKNGTKNITELFSLRFYGQGLLEESSRPDIPVRMFSFPFQHFVVYFSASNTNTCPGILVCWSST